MPVLGFGVFVLRSVSGTLGTAGGLHQQGFAPTIRHSGIIFPEEASDGVQENGGWTHILYCEPIGLNFTRT